MCVVSGLWIESELGVGTLTKKLGWRRGVQLKAESRWISFSECGSNTPLYSDKKEWRKKKQKAKRV